MVNRYLEKIAGILTGVMKPRPLENLVKRTKQIESGLMGRERKVGMGLSDKPLGPAQMKLEALKRQSAKKQWKA